MDEKCEEPGCRLTAEYVVILQDGAMKDLRQVNFCLRHVDEYGVVSCGGCMERATRIFGGKGVCERHWNYSFHDLKMKNRYGTDANREIENKGESMTDKKFPKYRLVLGKATVGTLWESTAKSGLNYFSGQLDLTALRNAVPAEKKTKRSVRVSRDGAMEEHELVRVAMFDAGRKDAGGVSAPTSGGAGF